MTIRRVIRLVVLFFITVLPAVYFADINTGSYIEWALYAVAVGIWALLVIGAGNVLMERKTAAAVYERVRQLARNRTGR